MPTLKGYQSEAVPSGLLHSPAVPADTAIGDALSQVSNRLEPLLADWQRRRDRAAYGDALLELSQAVDEYDTSLLERGSNLLKPAAEGMDGFQYAAEIEWPKIWKDKLAEVSQRIPRRIRSDFALAAREMRQNADARVSDRIRRIEQPYRESKLFTDVGTMARGGNVEAAKLMAENGRGFVLPESWQKLNQYMHEQYIVGRVQAGDYEGASQLIETGQGENEMGLAPLPVEVKDGLRSLVRSSRDNAIADAKADADLASDKAYSEMLPLALRGQLPMNKVIDSRALNPEVKLRLKGVLEGVAKQRREEAEGKEIVTDQVEYAKLYRDAVTLSLGRLSLTDYLSNVADARASGKITDSDRQALMEKANQEFKAGQAAWRERAFDAGKIQLVRVTENMMMEMQRRGAGFLEMETAQYQRQVDLRHHADYMNLFDTWLTEHPDATEREMFQKQEGLLVTFRSRVAMGGDAIESYLRAKEPPKVVRMSGPSQGQEYAIGELPGGWLPGAVPATAQTAPAGLESIWGELSESDRKKAIAILQSGQHTAADIVKAFRE